METEMTTLAVQKIARHYRALNAAIPLHPIRTKADYARAVTALNAMLDAGAKFHHVPVRTWLWHKEGGNTDGLPVW